jgi:hypothetical protein
MASDAADGGDGTEEGWYEDPYGIHEQRWVSKGVPTNLVSDHGVEGHDEPPDRPPNRPFVFVPDHSEFGQDLKRADDIDKQPVPDAASYATEALDANVVAGSPLSSEFLPPPSGEWPSAVFESPLQRKLRVRARRERWKKRWGRWFGKGESE